MKPRSRRDFLGDVGRGMVIAGIGPTLASSLGLRAPSLLAAESDRLDFGALEPLVALNEGTTPDRLLPLLVGELRRGTELKTLVAAAALANARAFGGEDYVGYHSMMALLPAYEMAQELRDGEAALPVLKVLYRNSARIQEACKGNCPTLARVALPENGEPATATQLRAEVRARRTGEAERTLACIARGEPLALYNALQPVVHDDINVHRIVLAWRAWDLLRLTGFEHAHTMLRQSVRFAISEERPDDEPEIRRVLPRVIDEHRLYERSLGDRAPDDRRLEELAQTILAGRREEAAQAAAAALAEGLSPDAVGEAISLAATQLLLHDPGLADGRPGRPRGSVHGASVGVHASDAANAWRHVAQVCDERNRIASLVVAAVHTAGQWGASGPFPYEERNAEMMRFEEPAALLERLEQAIRSNDQAAACALVHRYGTLGHGAEGVFEILLRYAVSEDGALHAEKYYRTVREEFARSRPSFRWRHLIALARVTASEHGQPAPGLEEARRLLARA